jgi:ferredoxin
MGARVRVDRNGCLSSGRCVAAAPAIFAFDDDRLAHAPEGETALTRDEALAIARRCPALAIDVLDDDGEPIEL